MRTRLPAMTTEILVWNGIDLFLGGGDEVEVEGEDGSGGKEGDENAEGVCFPAN